jgi:hypothetical protein
MVGYFGAILAQPRRAFIAFAINSFRLPILKSP